MKALCSERCNDWSSKFGPLGLKCREVTGDSELDDYFELQDTHIVTTTPVRSSFIISFFNTMIFMMHKHE